MFCICNNPLVVVGQSMLIPRGKDTATGKIYCPYCHRIYRVDLFLLKETDLSEETMKDNIAMRKGA